MGYRCRLNIVRLAAGRVLAKIYDTAVITVAHSFIAQKGSGFVPLFHHPKTVELGHHSLHISRVLLVSLFEFSWCSLSRYQEFRYSCSLSASQWCCFRFHQVSHPDTRATEQSQSQRAKEKRAELNKNYINHCHIIP